MVYITAGDIWYLRLLLLHQACFSYANLRKISRQLIAYSSFQWWTNEKKIPTYRQSVIYHVILSAKSYFVLQVFCVRWAPSLDREVFEGIHKEMEQFRNRVVICLGDFQPLLPVIEGGDPAAFVNASIKSSPLWNFFSIMRLHLNMRLLELNNQQDQVSEEELIDLQNQKTSGKHLIILEMVLIHNLSMTSSKIPVPKLFQCTT